MRVLLIDDHPVFAEGFEAMTTRLRPDWTLEIAATGDEALAVMAARLPDVVVSDVFLPDTDGFALAEICRTRWPDLPFMLVSGRDHATMGPRARRSAANGFIAKSMVGTDFVDSIEAVIAGRSIFTEEAPVGDRPALTPRQAQVLELLAEGHGNKEIRHRLGIAERTVRAHLTELFQLLGVHGRMPAVIRARELGLIE